MAKFLVQASYSVDGIKGVVAKGGTSRREAVEKMVADLGGHIEAFYFSFGESDAVIVLDLPDNVGAAAIGLAVSSTGMAATRTTVLLTPEEIDRAAATSVNYASPGS